MISYSTIARVKNPEDLVSYKTQLHVYLNDFVDLYLLSVCFLIFVPTSVINMAVFWKYGIKERINICFVCLVLLIVFLWFSMLQCKQTEIYEVRTKPVFTAVVLNGFLFVCFL